MNTGNREKAMRSAQGVLYLPFAGITLFRFNGFYLSFLQHPEDKAKLIWIFQLTNCNFIYRFSFYRNKRPFMKKILFALVLLVSVGLKAQKSGLIYDDHAQKRNVTGFNAVRVSHAIDLYLTQSNANEVAVSASSEEYRDRIITEVVGGTLIIRMAEDNGWFSWKKWGDSKAKAYVSIKEINALTASGASNVHVVGALESSKLKIKMSGASDLKGATIDAGMLLIDLSGASNCKGQIKANSVIVDCSGASDIELTGTTDDLAVEVSGASNAKLYNLLAKGANVHSSGASDAKVYVTQLLKAHASGASSIDYKGNPNVSESNSSGASNIKHKN
jgi:hypothetical protein